MSDRDGIWMGVDEPMEVPEDLKARVIHRMTSPDSAEDRFPLLDDVDGPRPVPSDISARLRRTIAGRGRSRRAGLYTAVAAAAVVTLFATTILIAGDRLSTRTTPPLDLGGDVSLLSFGSDEEFRQYMSSRAVEEVSQFGSPGYGPGGGSVDSQLRAGPPVAGQERTSSMAGESAPLQAPTESSSSAAKSAGADEGSFSTTNVQEKGVDEPDLVKTDGTVLVAISSAKLWVFDVTGERPAMMGSMPFPVQTVSPSGPADTSVSSDISIMPGRGQVEEGQMFLAEDRVIHIGQIYLNRVETRVTVVSIADPTAPKITSETTIEGSLVGARMSGGIVRLILRSNPMPELRAPDQPTQEDVEQTLEENRKIIREAKPEEWLPEFSVETPGAAPAEGNIHSWEQVQRPQEFSGIAMLSVVSLDPANPSPEDSTSIVGAGEIVYSNTQNLYVTTNQAEHVVIVPRGEPVPPVQPGIRVVTPEEYRVTTQIHKFSIAQPGAAVYRSSGEVEGTVLNQFSMSEKDGYLRIATTRPQLTEGSESESFVTVMEEKDDKLVSIGAVGNLGKGEQIYAVRFIGDAGYVVTFRQTDPLYVIDLRDPTSPVITGELKIPGFSNYLHPVGEDLLLGIGQDADDQGRVKGLQVSLFDVSDPAKPARLHQRTLGESFSSSEAQFDHHAFLYWPTTGLLVIPFDQPSERSQGFTGAFALEVDKAEGFSEVTTISHTGKVTGPSSQAEPFGRVGPQIRRSLVVRQNLIPYSTAGLLTNDLRSLSERAWIPFSGQ